MKQKTGGRHKVPMMMQMEATECGAASLAMILAYHGLWKPLADVRYDCGVSRDGSSLGNVNKAAKALGMATQAYRIAKPSDLEKVQLPCICHWEFNHFIVVTGISKKYIYVNDPARGKLRLTYEEFDRGMTGVILTMKPSESFRKAGKPASIVSFAKERLSGAREALIFTFLTGLLLTITGAIMPLLTQVFADDILTQRHPDWFLPFMGVFCLLLVAQVGVTLLSGIYMRKFEMKLSVIGNASFLWHVLHLPIDFFTQRSSGDIVTRQRTASGIASSLVGQLAPFVTNVVLILLYLFFMLRYSLALTGVVVGITLVNMLLVRLIAERQTDMSRQVLRNEARLSGVTMASLNCIETIKAAGAENSFFRRWTGYFATSYNSIVRMNSTLAYFNTLPQLLTLLGNTLVLAIGTYYILNGAFTVGMLMAFQSFMASFNAPVGEIADTMSNLITMRSNMERMEDVYRSDPDVAVTAPASLVGNTHGKLTGKLELRNVTYGYSRLAPPLFSDFNLTLEKGRSVAIVGGSGCGKSTLAKIIAGLYQPWSGEVLYDGKPLTQIPRPEFVNSVAMIDQDITLFEGTLAENIKMWDTSMEDFAMVIAAMQADIHHDIAGRPDAYDMHITEGGTNLSGGQRQRVEIATALVREPALLIMDEATSALDAVTEERIMKAIRRMNLTLVIVAHRLSTIRDCDEIIVMDHGHVAERGTHEELMKKQGCYFELMKSGSKE